MTQLNVEVAQKRLQLLHEVVGKPTILAFLINPNEPNPERTDVQAAARDLGVELHVLLMPAPNASSIGRLQTWSNCEQVGS